MAKTNRKAATVSKITPESLVAAASTGNEKRIVPLGGGTYAYVNDPVTGRILHVAVASEEFSALISAQAALSPAYAARLERELAAISSGDFPAALDALRAASAFTVDAG